MGKMKLPKSLLRLLFPKSRKSSNSNKANGNHGGGSSSRTNHHHASSSSSSSWEKDCLHLNSASPPHKKDDQAGYNIAVIEDDDDNETNYTTEAEESILSMSLPPPISLEELLLQCTTTASSILNNNANINIDNHSDEDEDDDDILLPTVGASIHYAANVYANDHQLHHANVITPPSSPGNDAANVIVIHDRNGNGDDNNDVKRDALLPVVEWDEIAIIPTATIHPNDTDISDHHDGGTSPPPPPPQSSTTTTTTAAAATTTTATVNETTDNNNSTNQTPIDQTKQNQKKKPRVQFSLHGEEARQRAMARQRKILSKAHLRLDSISETSLDHIKEVTTTTTPTSTATNEETGEELIPLLGDATSAATAKGRKPKRHSRRKSSLEEDEDTEAVVSSSASSVASIASSSYSWGRGKHRGNVSSYIFYESPTSPNKKSTSFSSPLDVAKSTLSEAAAAAAAVTNDTKENICNYSSQHHDDAIHKNHASAIQFFILLLCPTSRIFELLEINNYFDDIDETITAPTITIQDILSNAIPKHCTDKRLLLQKYVGLVRAEDGTEFVELTAKAFLVHPLSPTSSSSSSDDECEPHSQLFIQRNDLLVAILEGYTGYQMAKMAKPILRNSKFCDMIRRRSGIVSSSSGDSGGDNHASRGRSNGNNTVPLLSYNKEGSTVGVGIESIMSSPSKSRRNPTKKRDTKARSASSAGFKDDTYLSLCQQLKQLSKKLHIVDDEITREDGIALPVSPTKEDDVAGGGDGQEATTANLTNMATPTKEFKMTPKMVAHELAMNIEDIFADHDVEIVAVDADDDDETTIAGLDGETIDVDAEFDDRTDDDTFVSARSMRSLRSSRSMRSLLRKNENRSVIVANDENDDINKPVMEITTKRKERKERMARGNRGMFDNYEEDDMMLKIEAMARQAESEFESRKKGAVEVPRATIESTVDTMTNTKEDNVVQDLNAIADNEIDAIPNISEDDDVDDDIEISSPIPSPEPSSQTERDALARSFLNASTTMVSTMVAASQGRVNEVHVLQYLGVTIVCIAANFMQQARSAGAGGPMSPSSLGAGIGGGGGSGFGARDVLQSAMFLAFMVNGQRYMAKVTKK